MKQLAPFTVALAIVWMATLAVMHDTRDDAEKWRATAEQQDTALRESLATITELRAALKESLGAGQDALSTAHQCITVLKACCRSNTVPIPSSFIGGL